MWSRYDGAVVRDELQTLREHGLNVTRSFCFWPDFVPEPGQARRGRPRAASRDFLDAHLEARHGHDPDLHRRPHVRRELGSRLAGGPRPVSRRLARLAAGLVRGGDRAAVRRAPRDRRLARLERDAAVRRARRRATRSSSGRAHRRQAVRATGASQPISLGDGAWGIEISGADNGYSLRELAPLVDFVGPHVYPMQDDQTRQLLTAAFVCELAASLGQPVVLEEFGVSSDFASDENAADYYRQVLLHDAAGRRARVDRLEQLRLRRPPRRGSLSPPRVRDALRPDRPSRATEGAAAHSRRLRRAGRRAGGRGLGAGQGRRGDRRPRALRARAAVHRHRPTGRTSATTCSSPTSPRARRTSLSRSCASETASPTRRTCTSPRAPSSSPPPASTACERSRVGGATVYLSYFAGSTTNQRGPWLTWLDEIFGVSHRLRYGLVDPIEDDEAVFHFVEDFGDIAAGTRLSFPVAGEHSARSYLPVDSVGAEIVAIDGHGRPALLRHALGLGSTVLCTYPIEHMAARTPHANPESTWRIYSALASARGCLAAGARGRSPCPRRAAPHRRRPTPRCSSTAPRRRSRPSRSWRTRRPSISWTEASRSTRSASRSCVATTTGAAGEHARKG